MTAAKEKRRPAGGDARNDDETILPDFQEIINDIIAMRDEALRRELEASSSYWWAKL